MSTDTQTVDIDQLWRLYKRLKEQVRHLKQVAVAMERTRTYELAVPLEHRGQQVLRIGNALDFNQACREVLREA
jgi:hypothetical protein